MGTTAITLVLGDITEHEADAVVNAANSSLLGGGGVDGAIHRRGGPSILEACKAIRARQGECPAGEAVITTGGNLPAAHVIHTVGPIWRGGQSGEADTLKRCYLNSLALAVEHRLRSVAFASISTGVYGYPVAKAAKVAVQAVREFLAAQPDRLDRVSWVLFDETTYRVYEQTLNR